MSANPSQVVVVDDHPLLRQGTAGLVADQSDTSVVRSDPPRSARVPRHSNLAGANSPVVWHLDGQPAAAIKPLWSVRRCGECEVPRASIRCKSLQPGHLRWRRRVKPDKSPFRKVTQPRFTMGRTQAMLCVVASRGQSGGGEEREKGGGRGRRRRAVPGLQPHGHDHEAMLILLVGWPQLSGTLIVFQRNLNLSAFHHAEEVEQKATVERNPQGLTAVRGIH